MKGLLIAMGVVAAVGAQAVVLYSNTTQTGFRFGGTSGNITFDDVLVPVARNSTGGPMKITSVSVGLRRITGAQAVTADLYWAGINSTPRIESVRHVTTFTRGALVGSSVTEVLTVSNAGGLFYVDPNNSLVTGYSAFAIGLKLTGDTASNGWRMTSGPDANIDAFWDYTNPTTQTFSYFGGTPAATFYINVEGEPVPEPGTIAAIGLGLVGIIARRRRNSA